jgi:oxidase EvaA
VTHDTGVSPGEIARQTAAILTAIGKTPEDLAADPTLGYRVAFFLSATTPTSRFNTLPEILDWLAAWRATSDGTVELIPVEAETGNIRHDTGKFFSIEGVKVESRSREVGSWYQPIINQPEVGILGIIVKKLDGIYYFLMQAKTEPGNIDGYQISPTVQATQSNYTMVHGGKLPLYVDMFLDRANPRYSVIFEGKQSEEGARFWRKANLNIILEVREHDLGVIPPEFCWMTLHQLKRLLLQPNLVNICARTVLSCVP